jgi:hypothetical protein
MSDENPSTFFDNDAKRSRTPADTGDTHTSPNPKDKKISRPRQGGAKIDSLATIFAEMDEYPASTEATVRNRGDAMDDSPDLSDTRASSDPHSAVVVKASKTLSDHIAPSSETSDHDGIKHNDDAKTTNKIVNAAHAVNKDKMDSAASASVEESVFCMDFTLGFKNPTEYFDKLHEDTKKKRSVFDGTDLALIENFIEEAPALFGLENAQFPLSVDTWFNIFLAAYPIKSKKNPKRRFNTFGLTLAGTNPENVLSQESFDGYRILESPLACALGGAYNSYGCLWTSEGSVLIDWMEEKIEPTKLWQTFPIKERNLAKPFSASELFTESKSSFHCIEASMSVAMRMVNREDPEEWSVKIRKHLVTTGQVHLEFGTVKKALMRIAKTPPSVFGKDFITEDTKLTRSSMTALWTATYRTIGGIWMQPKQLASTSKATVKDTPPIVNNHNALFTIVEGKKARRKATFDTNTKDLTSTPKFASQSKSTSSASKRSSTCFPNKKPVHISAKTAKGPNRKFS